MEKYFKASPFALTASEESAPCWAGRPDLAARLRKIVTSSRTRHDSSLDVMWAKLGAGKSHVLFHLAYLYQADGRPNGTIPIMVEMPEKISSFLDVYRLIVAQLSPETIADFVARAKVKAVSAPLRQWAQVVKFGGAREKELAREWFAGERVALLDLKKTIGIHFRIEDDGQAFDVLCGIVGALADGKARLVIMLDEFQRIGIMREKSRNTICSRLRSLFSKNSSHLSMVFTLATDIESGARELIPPELLTLVGLRPMLSLPGMAPADAISFVRERFAFYRPSDFKGGPYDPFSEDAVHTILDRLESKGRDLLPREILQLLAHVADESGWDSKIDGAAAAEILKQLE